MKKFLYGIDAPPVVAQFGLIGIISLMIGAVGYQLLIGHHAQIAVILLIAALLFFSQNFIIAGMMIYSSLFGKLKMRDKIIALLNLKGNEQVLDVGCGRGLLLIGIAKKLTQTGKVFGIDLWRSEDQFGNQELRTRENSRIEGVSDQIKLISGDMTAMKFKDKQFDAIVSSLAIHNVPTREKRFKAIQEIDRTLKPDGRLIILDFRYTKDYAQYLKQLGWQDVSVSRLYFSMFPPVRLVAGIKPKV